MTAPPATTHPLDDAPRDQPLLDGYLRSNVAGDAATGDRTLDRRIAAADPLLRFLDRLHYRQHGRALLDYFRGGWSAHRVLHQLLRLRFGEAAANAAILDFGSGYGRTTRFLLREHPPDRITVSDVMADAVAFQRDTFGVAGVVSSAAPRTLQIAGRFDVVIAVSVFTHFHPDDFPEWLARLRALVAPGGLLVFTTNDERMLLPGRSLDASGAWFEPASENERLDPRRYGSTWVSEPFVARALAAGAGATVDYRRVPRGLWASQDVWVVAAGGAPLPDPLPLSLEPAGQLEGATLVDPSGTIELHGWATMPDGAPVASVEASIDGRVVASTAPDQRRPDVASRFASSAEGAARALPGWILRLKPPAGGFSFGTLLTLTATSRDGVAFTLHHDVLSDTLLFLRSETLHRRIAELEHEVRRRDLALGRRLEIQGALWWGVRNRHFELRALKRELALSRFWKLRNQWWAVKRWLGASRD